MECPDLVHSPNSIDRSSLCLCLHYLDHEEILVDDTIVRETSHGCDVLVGHIKLSAALVAVLILLAHPVHLLVHLCPVVESVLTRTRHSPGHTGWMPGSNAGNLKDNKLVKNKSGCDFSRPALLSHLCGGIRSEQSMPLFRTHGWMPGSNAGNLKRNTIVILVVVEPYCVVASKLW